MCVWASQMVLVVKNPPANPGDVGLIPGLWRSPGAGNGNLLQYFAWKIPWTEEPGGLQSMALQRLGHDRAHTPSPSILYIHTHTHMHSYTCKRKKMKVLVNSLTQGSNPGLLHCRWILYHLNHEGSPHRHTYRVNGYPLQYSCWGNLVDRGAWRTTVHGVAKGWTWLKELSTYAYVGACVCIYVCVCIYIYIYLHLYSMFSCEIQMHKSSYLWKDHRERYKITHSKGLIS